MQKLTKHHIIPRNWEKLKWSNDPNNIKMLKDNVHRALHILFANKSPVEQIEYMMYNINTTALTYEFKNEVWKILSIDENDFFYKDWLYIPKKELD